MILRDVYKNKNEVPHVSIKRCDICNAVPQPSALPHLRQIGQFASFETILLCVLIYLCVSALFLFVHTEQRVLC